MSAPAMCNLSRGERWTNAKWQEKKKMTIENWSRENPKVVWKGPFQISMEPIFTTASSVSPCLLSGAPSILTGRPQPDVFSVCKPSATMQITSNWCCQRRSIEEILSATVKIEHGRQPQELIGTAALNLLLSYFSNLTVLLFFFLVLVIFFMMH